MQKLPVPHQIQPQQVAPHALVQARIVQHKGPLDTGRDARGAAQRLQRLCAEVGVEDDEGGVVGEEELGFEGLFFVCRFRGGRGRGGWGGGGRDERGNGRDEGQDGQVAPAEEVVGPRGEVAVVGGGGEGEDGGGEEVGEDGARGERGGGGGGLVDEGDGDG